MGRKRVETVGKESLCRGREYIAGTHCKFCKAKAQCKALSAYHMGLAKYDFQDAALLVSSLISPISYHKRINLSLGSPRLRNTP